MIKSSCFNVPFDHDGRCAVWNSLSDCIVELSREEQLALQNNSLDEISPQRRSLFLEKGIITDEAEEMRSFLQRRHEDRQLRPLYFRILTTTACNARCGYCYERDFPVQSMDEDTAASVADFIVDRYKAHPLRGRLNIEWFGGEPCLNTATINTITERLIAEGIPFRCQMTSNGLLLTRPLIEGLRERELRSIQITLDAAGKEYEEIKGLPEGSFNRVL